jgi:hypothetical protein
MKTVVDIGYGDIDIYVDDRLVLHIGQVSDEDVINLFLYPYYPMVESVLHKEHPAHGCTHEILIKR